MKKMNLILIGLMFILQINTLFAAGQQEAEGPEKLVILMPGAEPQGFSDFVNSVINPKLTEDINAVLEVSWSPWSEYWSKTDLTLVSGQRLDWMWTGIQFVPKHVAKGHLLELDDLVDQYGQDLLKVNPKKEWASLVFDGKTMGIPLNAVHADTLITIVVREDLVQEFGMDGIETLEDLEKFQKLTLENYPNMVPNFGELVPAMIHRTEKDVYNWIRVGYRFTYPFYINDSEAGDKVYSYYESDLFRKFAYMAADWNKKGYIPEDSLINRLGTGRLTSGQSSWGTGATTRDIEQQLALEANVPTGVFKEYNLNPSKPRYILTSTSNIHTIPATAKNPAKSMEFINWIYKNEENYDFLLQRSSENIFYEWMFRNANYQKFPDWVSDEKKAELKTWDTEAEYSKMYGFTFDQTPVKSQVAQVQTVLTEMIEPIQMGFLDYDENIDEAIAKLKAAGLDDIHEEMQSQFSAFMSSK